MARVEDITPAVADIDDATNDTSPDSSRVDGLPPPDHDAGPVTHRLWRAMRGRALLWAARMVLLAIVVVVWEWAVETERLRPLYASRPSVIWEELMEMVLTTAFWSVHVWATVKSIVLGLAIGATSGVAVALVMAKWDSVYRVLSPFMVGLYSLPKIALAPLMILWFGIGIASKVALVVSVVFFIMFFNTHAGVRAVDRDSYNAVRMMGAGQWALWRHVILPSATPWIFAGMRVSLAFGLTAAVVGELIASQVGLGNVLAQAAGSFQTGRVFAVLIVLGVFGVMLYGVMDLLERHMLRWREPDRPNVTI